MIPGTIGSVHVSAAARINKARQERIKRVSWVKSNNLCKSAAPVEKHFHWRIFFFAMV